MSMVERRYRHGRGPEAAPHNKRHFFRMVAVGSAAVFALSTCYQAAFAGSGFHSDYTGPESNDGLIIAAGVGGAIALAYAIGIAGRDRDRDDDKDKEKKSSGIQPLPEGSQEITNVSLVPGDTAIEAGTSRAFDLRVQRKNDNAWYSVTDRPETAIEVKNGGEALVRQDGTKNVFLVPVTANSSMNGQNVVVVGKYSPKSGQTLVAESRLELHVPAQ